MSATKDKKACEKFLSSGSREILRSLPCPGPAVSRMVVLAGEGGTSGTGRALVVLALGLFLIAGRDSLNAAFAPVTEGKDVSVSSV